MDRNRATPMSLQVLPHIVIRIPCLPALPRVEADAVDCSGSSPRLLPWPVIVLLLTGFCCFTAVAIGGNGVNYVTQRVTGRDLLPTEWVDSTPTSSSGLSDYQRVQNERLAREAVERAARQARRHAESPWPSFTLIDLPPLSAVPFQWLVKHEYLSLVLFLVRTLLLRPLWHAWLWWHLLCALVSVGLIVQWRWRLRSNTSTSPARAPKLPLLCLHATFWALQALLFGWPAVFLLQRQLSGRTKAS